MKCNCEYLRIRLLFRHLIYLILKILAWEICKMKVEFAKKAMIQSQLQFTYNVWFKFLWIRLYAVIGAPNHRNAGTKEGNKMVSILDFRLTQLHPRLDDISLHWYQIHALQNTVRNFRSSYPKRRPFCHMPERKFISFILLTGSNNQFQNYKSEFVRKFLMKYREV